MDSKKQVYLEALKLHLGNITKATDEVGISRQTHYDWIDKDPEFKAAYEAEDYQERLKDLIREKLNQKLNNNDTAVIIFMAKAVLKYAERQEIDVSKIGITWVEERYTDNNEIDPKTDGRN